jgi:hypothetical protein
VGKWVIYFNNANVDHAWKLAVKLFRENSLSGVYSMKCSTTVCDGTLVNAGSNSNLGINEDVNVIIFYCNNSYDEDLITSIGRNIAELFHYRNQNMKYYKVGANMANMRHDIGIGIGISSDA